MNPNDMTGYPTLDQVQMVASFGNAPDSVVRGIIRAAIDLYREGAEVLAWVTDDGRAIHAREKSQAIASGVAFASDARAYSIPAYTRPPSLPAGESQTSALNPLSPGEYFRCDECHEPAGNRQVCRRCVRLEIESDDAVEAQTSADDRKDAARYRWLREKHDEMEPGWHVRTEANTIVPLGELDATIDAAIQTLTQPTEPAR